MQKLKSTTAWQELSKLAPLVKRKHMRDMFANEPERAEKYSIEAAGLFLDYSKNRITQEVFDALIKLAQQQSLDEKRTAMFTGEHINQTEQRAVLHTALRNLSNEPVLVDGKDVMPDVRNTLSKIQAFTAKIHNGEHKGFTGKKINTVVSLGIGGSFLGPQLVTDALKPYQVESIKVHFVANVDGSHIFDVLQSIDVETTLFVMASKSFTTQETLQNTLTAKDWFLKQGTKEADIAKHFVAISSNVTAAVAFGMSEDNVFPMADWVGGRYSLWSAIGLPISLTLGFEHFKALLAGAYEMDVHFQKAEYANNMPVILAMLGIWYRNFLGSQSHAILPYYHYLKDFPAYVQQLDMESNGKSVTLAGEFLEYGAGPIIWGGEGTNAQHSFYQLIHQSNLPIPVDFILPISVPNQLQVHHEMLASNCFGQAQALMQGKTFDECLNDLANDKTSKEQRQRLAHHKTMPGNNPSNTLLCEQLDPKTLGSLIALYEHKVFVQGCIWDLNSFDQWGVELGKVLGNQVLGLIQGKDVTASTDSSTQQLINRFKS